MNHIKYLNIRYIQRKGCVKDFLNSPFLLGVNSPFCRIRHYVFLPFCIHSYTFTRIGIGRPSMDGKFYLTLTNTFKYFQDCPINEDELSCPGKPF